MRPERPERPPALGAVLAVALACITPCAQAETLQEAWDAALSADRGLLAARETTAAAGSTLEAARAASRPRVGVEAGYAVLGSTPTMRAEFLGQSVQLPVAQTSSAAYKATVSMPLAAGGRIERGIDAAAAAQGAAQAGEEGHRQDLKLRVAEAYIAVLRAGRGRELARSHVTRLESHAQDVRNRLAQGLVARSDLLAAEVALAEARQKALQAGHAADLAQAQYNRLLGRPLEQTTNLEPPADPLGAAAASTLPELTQRAQAQRSELAQLLRQIEALRHQAAAIRAEAAPQVAVSGGYGYQQNRYQVHPGQWFAGVGVAWSLFDGGVVGHRAGAVERQLAALAAQREELASLLALQVRQAWLAVQEAHQRTALGTAAVMQAEENLRVVQDRYVHGLTTHTEVLGAEALRLGSQLQDAEARFDGVLAGLRLRRSVGEL
jgi:outer membrane protein TolC